jgi:hypothetical protein
MRTSEDKSVQKRLGLVCGLSGVTTNRPEVAGVLENNVLSKDF